MGGEPAGTAGLPYVRLICGRSGPPLPGSCSQGTERPQEKSKYFKEEVSFFMANNQPSGDRA